MSVTYLEAIREAQAQSPARGRARFHLRPGCARKVRRRVQGHERSGGEFPGRVLNTPISEDAMVGTAIGAAMEGMRPIVEMQFADFSSIALNQILNNAGTQYWRTNVPCPITVRLPSGGTKGSGPFHSQSMEGLYSHYPGLVVVDARHGGRRLHHVDRRGRDRRPGHLLRAQISLLPPQGRRAADRKLSGRQGANRQAGARSHHRDLQRDGARSARGREGIQRRTESKSKWSICAR